jgi:predicted amidohydrolase YtcJ
MRTFMIVTLLMACLPASLSLNTVFAQGSAADLVITNATIHTMDTGSPTAEAVAVLGDRIVAVGSSAEIGRFIGAHTRVIDAKGALVLPGFNDAHVHFLWGGFQLSSVDLRDAGSTTEFADRIRQFSEKLPKSRWITGGDWDHERWSNAPLPTKELVDAFTTDRPVFVSRLDGHMALANSYTLRLAGVTRDTPDPPGGLIVHDAKTGDPTGVLKDAAMNYVYKIMPDPSVEEKMDAARAATNHAASLGVTSVQDMSAGNDVGIYQALLENGELKTRIYAMSPLPDWSRLTRVGIHHAFGSEMLRIGGLKGFADGSLGSTTALFFEPYLDARTTSGLPGDEMFPEGAMAGRVRAADSAGLQVMIHAIGDKANDAILSAYEQAARTNGTRDRRFRIEHAQHLRAQDIARFGRGHIIASMQPYHCIDDGRWAEKRIGHERAHGTYAFRSLLDSGAVLAFGSDWTVAPLDPILGIYAAVTRRTLDGKNPDGWVPEQKITVEEAIHGYTVGSAYAEFRETVKGTIAAGKLADIVILSQNIFTIDPIQIEHTHVTTTVMNGRVVYERSN